MLVAAALAALLSGCSREPSESDLLAALQRYHGEWLVQKQTRTGASPQSPLVDLPRDARLSLQIRSVRKERCRPETDSFGVRIGYICTVVVSGTTPFAHGVRRRIEIRVVEGTRGWLMQNPRAVGGAEAAGR
jgi:hypothetical protein